MVAEVGCAAMRIEGGAGRVGDLYVANAWFRAVLRAPGAALTVPGVGGATAIDAAPWGEPDALRELIPLVDGGWLDVRELTLDEAHVRVAGPIVSLPGRVAPGEGAWAEVTWAPDPDGPWLRITGADALWLHPLGGSLLDGQVVGGTTLGHDGAVVADRGGVIEIGGATGLLVAPDAEAPAWWADAPRTISGEAAGADLLGLYRGAERVGAIPLAEPAFSVEIQGDVTAVRAEADGRAPGQLVAPDADLILAPGAPGALTVAVIGRGTAPPPLWITWRDDAGREGTAYVPYTGATLPLGAGTYQLDADAGPAFAPTALTVTVPPSQTALVRLTLTPRFDPGPRVLVDLRGKGARSDTFRGSDADALREAAGRGLGFVVVAPESSAAGTQVPVDDTPPLRWRDGVQLTHPEGWRLTAWPFAASVRYGGLGAPAVNGLTPEDALAAVWGGPGTNRFTVVDLAWLDVADAPWAVRPAPDLVHLDAPDPALTRWSSWFTWLDAGVPLVPVGPLAWARVDDPTAFAGVDVEQALTRGDVVATTGGLVTFTVDGWPPGEIVPAPSADAKLRPHAARITVASAEPVFTRVLLIADGVVIATWAAAGDSYVATIPRGARWALAVATDDTGAAWAATGPVWLTPPAQPIR